MKDYFSQLASFAVQEGLPVQQGARTWRSAESLQRNAELAIWAVINASALAIGDSDRPSARVRIEWGADQALANMLERLGSRRKTEIVFMDNDGSLRVVPEFNIKLCLAYIEAPGADISETNLRNADLQYANLRGANMFHADLSASNVTGARFEEASFFWAHLGYVDFREAHMDGCEMAFAGISGANFSSTQLSQIAFTPLSFAVKHDFDLSKARIEHRYRETPEGAVGNAIEILESLLSRLKKEPIDDQRPKRRVGLSRAGSRITPLSNA